MFARTPRLILRPGWPEDAEALAAAIGHKDVLCNLARAPMPYGVEDARAFLSASRDRLLPSFLVFARTEGAVRLVGGCGIHRVEEGRPELGYWIARPHWGLGFATEAARAVMAIARASHIGPVGARHVHENAASARVLHKLGFRPTGRCELTYSRARGCEVPCDIFIEDGYDATPGRDGDGMAAGRHLIAA